MDEKRLAELAERMQADIGELCRRMDRLEQIVGDVQRGVAGRATAVTPTRPAPPPLPLADRTSPPLPGAQPPAPAFHSEKPLDEILLQLEPAPPAPAPAESVVTLEPAPPLTPAASPPPSESPLPQPASTEPASDTNFAALEPAPPSTPAAPPPPPASPRPRPAPTEPRLNFEQLIGTKWMLIAGVVLLLIAGGYFFKLAYDLHWINPLRRLILGSLFGLLMIAGGEVSLYRRMRFFAAGLIGVGIVWLYQAVYVASPSGWLSQYIAWSADYQVADMGSQTAFLLMCLVTVLGMVLSIQTRMLTAAVISLVGAIATPILLSTHVDHQVLLMSYLLAVDVGFLIVALLRGWQALAPLTLIGSTILFVGWFGKYYTPDALATTTLFAWLLLGIHGAYAVVGTLKGRVHEAMANCVVAGGAAVLAVCMMATCTQAANAWLFAVELMALAAGVFAFGLWRRNIAFSITALVGAEVLLWIWFLSFRGVGVQAPLTVAAWFLLLAPVAAMQLGRWPDQLAVHNTLWGIAGAALGMFLVVGCQAQDQGYVFALQLMALASVLAAWGLFRGGSAFAILALAGAETALWAWYLLFRGPEIQAPLTIASWFLLLLPAAAVALRRWPDRLRFDNAQWTLAGAALGAFLIVSCQTRDQGYLFALQLMALASVLCAWAIYRGGSTFAILALAGGEVALWVWYLPLRGPEVQVPLTIASWFLLLLPASAIALRKWPDRLTFHNQQWALAGTAMGLFLIVSCEGTAQGFAFALQWMALAAILFGWGLWRGGIAFTTLTVLLAEVGLWLWFLNLSVQGFETPLTIASWFLVGLPLASVALDRARTRADTDISQWMIVGVAMAVGWSALAGRFNASFLLGQMLALDVLVLAVCLWRRWHWPRAGVLAWTAVLLLSQHARPMGVELDTSTGPIWFTCIWTWGFYALVLGDVLVRSWGKRFESPERIDAGLMVASTAAMFVGTLVLLNGPYHWAMGRYTFSLGGGILVLVCALHVLAKRIVLSNTFLGMTLVLLAVAAPIQWNDSTITVAWLIEALAAVFFARQLGNRVLGVAGPSLLVLAMARFYVLELANDAWLASPMFDLFGVGIARRLLLGVALGGGGLAMAGAIRGWRRGLFGEDREHFVGAFFTYLGVACYMITTVLNLPPAATTWWWIVLAVGLAAVAVRSLSPWLIILVTLVASIATAKWVLFDTLTLRAGGVEELMPVLNWQWLAGVALAAGLLTWLRMLRDKPGALSIGAVVTLQIIACLLVGWGGTFEVERFFRQAHGLDWEIGQAIQMSWSIWWAIYAVALLIGGFAYRRASVRYTAIALFAVVIVKVFAVDLARIHMAYRVLSLLGVGLLLLGGAFLYNRKFRTAKALTTEGTENTETVEEQQSVT